jgi:hypothetical protein
MIPSGKGFPTGKGFPKGKEYNKMSGKLLKRYHPRLQPVYNFTTALSYFLSLNDR